MGNVGKFRLYYFLVSVVGGIYGMAMPLYYKVDLGFDPMQVSFLIAMPSIVMLFQPFWGIIVDKYERPKEIAILGLMLSSLILMPIIFLDSYSMVVLIIFLYSLFRAPVWSTVDNIIITYCMNENVPYGPLRVFASIAWGSSLLIFFPFILIFGFSSYFIFSLMVSIVLSIMILKFPGETKIKVEGEEESELEFLEGLKRLLKSKSFYYIISYTFFFSAMFVTNLNYLIIYLNDLKVSLIVIAFIIFMSIVPEFVILPNIEKFEKKFDPITWLIIVCLLYAVRYFVIGSTTNIFMITVASMLHGVGMSFYIPIFLKHFKVSVPSNISTTALTISGLMSALSGIIMSYLAGVVTIIYGLNYVFYLNVVAMIFAIIVLVLYKMHRVKQNMTEIV